MLLQAMCEGFRGLLDDWSSFISKCWVSLRPPFSLVLLLPSHPLLLIVYNFIIQKFTCRCCRIVFIQYPSATYEKCCKFAKCVASVPSTVAVNLSSIFIYFHLSSLFTSPFSSVFFLFFFIIFYYFITVTKILSGLLTIGI